MRGRGYIGFCARIKQFSRLELVKKIITLKPTVTKTDVKVVAATAARLRVFANVRGRAGGS